MQHISSHLRPRESIRSRRWRRISALEWGINYSHFGIRTKFIAWHFIHE
jgi:hypothetical protein